MRIPLYIAARTLWRIVLLFPLLEGTWVLLAVLLVARREPLLGGWSALHLAPILAVYAAGPCLLAAFSGAVAGTFAGLRGDGELTAAAAAGIGPLRWLWPVLALGVLAAGWALHDQASVFPAAREAKHARTQLLMRSPDVCLQLLAQEPDALEGLLVQVRPTGGGTFESFWAVETGDDGLPRRILQAPRGTLAVPEERDQMRLELDGFVSWSAHEDGEVEELRASHARIDRSTRLLRRKATVRGELREQTLAELWRSAREPSPAATQETRDYARAELASRLALVLSFPPLALVAAALGLLVARGGAWLGTAAGVACVGALHLPCLSFAARHVANGGTPLAFALLLVPLAAALPWLRVWRCG